MNSTNAQPLEDGRAGALGLPLMLRPRWSEGEAEESAFFVRRRTEGVSPQAGLKWAPSLSAVMSKGMLPGEAKEERQIYAGVGGSSSGQSSDGLDSHAETALNSPVGCPR